MCNNSNLTLSIDYRDWWWIEIEHANRLTGPQLELTISSTAQAASHNSMILALSHCWWPIWRMTAHTPDAIVGESWHRLIATPCCRYYYTHLQYILVLYPGSSPLLNRMEPHSWSSICLAQRALCQAYFYMHRCRWKPCPDSMKRSVCRTWLILWGGHLGPKSHGKTLGLMKSIVQTGD